ncbi:hypothetical protein BDV93DRAFT_570562 [Ceratobasidium sp. AG-I]|nr:hypothetical protein BDV93DRAFT_570562 [Ceratobasidium sp. AG-I]
MDMPHSNSHKAMQSVDLSSFSRAASCLSQAATTLSTAAQAMAMAAEAFSTAGLELENFFFCGSSMVSSKHMVGTPQESQGESPSLQNLGGYSSSIKSEHIEPDPGDPESTEDIDYYMSGTIYSSGYIPTRKYEDEDYVHALLKRQQEEKDRQESLSNVSSKGPTTPTQDNPPYKYTSNQSPPDRLSPAALPQSPTPETTHTVGQPFQTLDHEPQTTPSRFQRHIIVNCEADVLPVVCAVSRGFDKVVVYMHCALSSISLYQKIMKVVTETSVYSVTNPTQNDIDRTSKAFDRQNVRSDIALESTESLCVIHMGWPQSAEAFLVAPAHEQGIYPSCSEVLSLTSPWPEDSYLLIGNVAETLRPKVQSALSEIPDSLKEAHYLNWITLHGPKGSRYVTSWTPATLVSHANSHLCDVLQYRVQEGQTNVSSSSSISFPSVSTEFVKSNGLDSAVDEGVLNTTGMPSSPKQILKGTAGVLSGTHLRPAPGRSTNAEPATQKELDQLDNSYPVLNSPIPSTGSDQKGPTDFSISTYSSCKILTVQDEFDVLPVVCELAQSYGKVVCYLAYSLSVVTIYKKLIQDATGLEVIIGIDGPAAIEFRGKSKAIFLLPEYFHTEVVLDSNSVACLIHAGWPSNTNRYLAQIAQHAAPISILVAYAQDANVFPSEADIISQMIPYAREDMLVAPSMETMRTSVGESLVKMQIQDMQALYENWLSDHGPYGHRHVQSWSPLILALRGNQYLLDVLKYRVRLKVKLNIPASLPALSPTYVAFHGLQSAVDAGILNVSAPATIIVEPNVAKPAPSLNCAGSNNKTATSSTHAPVSLRSARPTVEQPGGETSTKGSTNAPREYIIVQDTFDVLPAVCNLSDDKAYKNTICYVKFVGTMQILTAQIQKMTSKPVFVIATENSAAIQKVLQAFDSATGGLVFCNSLIPPISKIYVKKIDQVIHMGWTGDIVSYVAQTTHSSLSRTQMILTPPEHATASQPVDHLRAVGLQVGTMVESSLALSRDQWRRQLKEAPKKSLNGCYMDWIQHHGAGTYKVQSWSKVDLVLNANIFASSVLLRGTGGCSSHLPLGGPLAVTPGFVKRQKLQPAIDAKVLRVED